MPAAVFAVLILSFVPSTSTAQSCSLPGLWLAEDRKDSVGMWLEFAPDGSVVRAQGRIIDGEYSLKGETLTLTTNATVAGDGGRPVRGELSQRVVVKIAGREMTRKADPAIFSVAQEESTDTRGRRRASNPDVSKVPMPAISQLEEMKLAKVADGDGSDHIAGVWAWQNKSGRAVFERFAGKKRFAVLEPLGGQKGTFKLEDNKLSVTADGTTTAVNVTCAPTQLALEVGGGKMTFVKFQ